MWSLMIILEDNQAEITHESDFGTDLIFGGRSFGQIHRDDGYLFSTTIRLHGKKAPVQVASSRFSER
jgi:hypothetical protein